MLVGSTLSNDFFAVCLARRFAQYFFQPSQGSQAQIVYRLPTFPELPCGLRIAQFLEESPYNNLSLSLAPQLLDRIWQYDPVLGSIKFCKRVRVRKYLGQGNG